MILTRRRLQHQLAIRKNEDDDKGGVHFSGKCKGHVYTQI